MPLPRDQLGVVMLAGSFVVLAGICGASYSSRLYATTSFGFVLELSIQAVAVGVPITEAAMLACWSAVRKDTAKGWSATLLALMLVGYAFASGSKIFAPAHGAEVEVVISIAVFVGTSFFVVYAYVMPMAAFWQWRLVTCGDVAAQQSERRLSLGQMFRWTFAVTLPFGVSQLFVPGQTDGTMVLASFLACPFLLPAILPVSFAAFNRNRRGRQIAWSLLSLFAIVAAELGVFMVLILATRSWSGPVFNFWNLVFPQLVMIAVVNITCFLVAMLSSLWLQHFGYNFVTTSNETEPLEHKLAV